MRRTLLAAAILGFLATPVSAQAEDVSPELVIGFPVVDSADGKIPLTMDGTAIVAPWTLTFSDPASAAVAFGGEAILMTWDLTCEDAELFVTGPRSFSIPFVPGQAEYADEARFAVSAMNSTPGVNALSCLLSAQTSASAQQLTAQDEVVFLPSVAYNGAIRITVDAANKSSGPQKEIHYRLDVENQGNARTLVTFELAEGGRKGNWAVVRPDDIVLEPGQTLTAIVQVVTAFHDGFNDDTMRFTIRAIATAADDPEAQGDTHDIPLKASAKGFYIPGPAPIVLLLGLALVVALRRRAVE